MSTDFIVFKWESSCKIKGVSETPTFERFSFNRWSGELYESQDSQAPLGMR